MTPETATSSHNRRSFMLTAAALGSLPVAVAFHNLSCRISSGTSDRTIGYGPLKPVEDENTGLELLKLPEGFRYVSFGWVGDELDDGTLTPDKHDGMAVIATDGSQITLCRNHEIKKGALFGNADGAFDNQAGGGCINLVFDTEERALKRSWSSLGGTIRNCAGGPTPWGTWLSCEESLVGPGSGKYKREHGWVFEVPATGTAEPVPLKEMGRFVHEAVAVDPTTGVVYETEDRKKAGCGFYRFIPQISGKLSDGGRLQMMKVVGHSDLSGHVRHHEVFEEIQWVDIEEPMLAHTKGTKDKHGVFAQGRQRGATKFARLEGCWQGNDCIYFVSTYGGAAEKGQIWGYDPRNELLRLVFESPDAGVLDRPDNITVSPHGAIVLCDHLKDKPHRLLRLGPQGELFTFAVNNMVLHGEKNGIEGDFREREWAGPTFSPDGKWLFANIQEPGITFAITGPWEKNFI